MRRSQHEGTCVAACRCRSPRSRAAATDMAHVCCNPPLLETLNADADFTDGNASGIVCLVRVLMPRNWIEDQPPNAVVGKCLVPIITADVGNDVRMVSLASMFWSTIAPICSPISPQMKLSCNDFSPLVFVWKPWRCLCLGCVTVYVSSFSTLHSIAVLAQALDSTPNFHDQIKRPSKNAPWPCFGGSLFGPQIERLKT